MAWTRSARTPAALVGLSHQASTYAALYLECIELRFRKRQSRAGVSTGFVPPPHTNETAGTEAGCTFGSSPLVRESLLARHLTGIPS
jgi:hypothetical protein